MTEKYMWKKDKDTEEIYRYVCYYAVKCLHGRMNMELFVFEVK